MIKGAALTSIQSFHFWLAKIHGGVLNPSHPCSLLLLPLAFQGKLVERPLEQNLEKVLSPADLDMVMTSQHRVVKSIQMLGETALQVR